MDGLSEYAQRFDEHNINWINNHTQNRMFLMVQQQYANDRFHAEGYLFLSDVYRMLGFRETKDSRMVGWAKNYPTGEKEVRFTTVEKPNGETWIDFNVHGNILDLFDKG